MSQDGKRSEFRSASVDGRLRRALDADPKTVQRVVRRALSSSTPSDMAPRFRWRMWAAATAVVVVSLAAVALWESGRSNDEALTVPLITNASGELVLVLPGGRDETKTVRRDPSNETPVIFNNSRVTAAIVPGIEPWFVFSGGGS